MSPVYVRGAGLSGCFRARSSVVGLFPGSKLLWSVVVGAGCFLASWGELRTFLNLITAHRPGGYGSGHGGERLPRRWGRRGGRGADTFWLGARVCLPAITRVPRDFAATTTTAT